MAITYSLTAVTRLLLLLCLLSGHVDGVIYYVNLKLTNAFYPAAGVDGHMTFNMDGQREHMVTSILENGHRNFSAGSDLYKYAVKSDAGMGPVHCVSLHFQQSWYGTTDLRVEYLKVSYIEEGAMHCHVFHFPSWPGGDMHFSVYDDGTNTLTNWGCDHQ